MATSGSVPTSSEQAPKLARPRILLVEDEPKLCASLAEGLRLEEWDVVTAASGTAALELIRAHEFNLVVLDWMLPDMEGLEVLRQVRARLPRLPVLMMTARAGHFAEIIAFQNGATDYVTKPFAFDDVLARCHVLIAPALRVLP